MIPACVPGLGKLLGPYMAAWCAENVGKVPRVNEVGQHIVIDEETRPEAIEAWEPGSEPYTNFLAKQFRKKVDYRATDTAIRARVNALGLPTFEYQRRWS